MESDPDRAWRERHRIEDRLTAWGSRLHAWGLEGLAAALLDAAEPLGPLWAQVIYVAQPALTVFWPSAQVGQWARLVEDPANIAWMRDRLTGPRPVGGGAATHEEDSPDGPDD